MSKSRQILVCGAAALVTDADGVVKRIMLLPLGKLPLRDPRGPYYVKDAAHAAQIIAASKAAAGAQDMMIDYDHQSIFGAKDGVGGTAPAAGWIRLETMAFETIEGKAGIWADVDWTAPAESRLLAREYRYLSPTFKADPKTGLIAFIHNAAVTNTPAIDGLPAIAASLQSPGDSMDLTALAAMLGLPADATLEQVTAALEALKAANDQSAASTKAIAAALGLAETVGGDELVTAAAQLVAASGRPDPKKFVPIEGLTALQAQVSELLGDKVAKIVDEAIGAFKLAPALRDWAIERGTKDFKDLEAFLAKSPAVIAPGRTAPTQPRGDVVTLSADQEALCEQMGWDKVKYLDTIKQEQA